LATNGNHSINSISGNAGSSGPWKNFASESFGLGAAELVSIGVSLGAIALAPSRDKPGMLKDASKVVGKCIEPYLDPIERGIRKVCKIEDCQPNMDEPRQKRAEQYARTLILWTGAAIASYGSKIAVRKLINILAKNQEFVNTGKPLRDFFHNYLIPNDHDMSVFLWDEGIHLGSLFFMNTVGAKQTDHMIHGASSVLQKWGISKERANRTAEMGVIWEGSNIMGFILGGIGRIGYRHFVEEAAKKGVTSHVEQLNSTTALHSHPHP